MQKPCLHIFQRAVETSCLRLFELFSTSNGSSQRVSATLRKDQTIYFLQRGLKHLSDGYECLDASRPWLTYWILHGLEILNVAIQGQQRLDIIYFLATCQNPNGGFGGGPGQLSHLAPTYAAVNSLVILGGHDAYDVIDRPGLANWLNALRLKDGSFVMHQDGEVDIRGVYCALSAAKLANVYSPELFHRTAHWVLKYVNSVINGKTSQPPFVHSLYTISIFSFILDAKHMKVVLVESQEWKPMVDTHFVVLQP